MKALFALPLALFVLAFAGCGETTTVVTPERTVEKKITVKDDKIETKEKTVKDNADGTTTKTETKTETK